MQFQAPFDIMDMRRQNMAEYQINQAPQQQMMETIGGALEHLMGSYVQGEANKASGRAYKKAFEVVGPSMGMTMDKLQAINGGKMNDMDWFNMGQMIFPMGPSLINSRLGQQRMGVAQATPYAQQQLKNANTQAEEGPAGDYSHIE